MVTEEQKQTVERALVHFDERSRRIFMASLPNLLGVTAKEISEVFDIDKNTMTAGKKDLESGDFPTDNSGTKRRVRKPGGGRKSILEKNPEVLEALEAMIDQDSYGNPENPLRWTTRSRRNLEEALREKGFSVGRTTIGKLLQELDYSLQQNKKMKQQGEPSPDRDAQFRHINDTAKAYMEAGQPVISVDCKKKENLGEYYNKGAEYMEKGKPVEVLDHDFPNKELGKVAPYGVYDTTFNEGFVNVGVSRDTAEFAAASIRMWWEQMGSDRYPDAEKLYITADGGGSNGSRCRLWKKELQALADETGLAIEVSHFPPGTSKWNKIEHKMFCFISKNWRARPLETLETVVSLIANTTTKKGLKIECAPDLRIYETGKVVTDEEMSNLNLIRNEFHGEWNYAIIPRS